MSKPISPAPPGWSWKQLGQLAKIQSGGTPSRNIPSFWGGSIPWATPTDITRTSGVFLQDTSERITKSGLASSSAKLLPAGSILMTSRATVGESKIATSEICTNQGFKSLVPYDNVDSIYLYYQLTLHKHRYANYGTGTTFLEVNKKDTERFEILVPDSLLEQRLIAEILSTLDEQIAATEATTKKLQIIRQGIVQNMILGGVQPVNWKFHPLQKSWEISTFGKEFELQLGKMLSKAAKTGHDEFPYIGNRSVQWGSVILSHLETMTFSMRERAKYALQAGDLLICEGGEVGRAAIWRGASFTCFYQKAIHRARVKTGRVTPEFALLILQLAAHLGWFANYMVKTSIAHLPREQLIKFPIPVPSQIEQKEICEMADSIQQQINLARQELEKLQLQKQGLMHDLLTGKERCTP